MHPYCAVCATLHMQTIGEEVDHVQAKEKLLDPYDHAYLRTLCKTHHSQKTILTEGAHRKGRKRFQVIGPDGWPIPYGDI